MTKNNRDKKQDDQCFSIIVAVKSLVTKHEKSVLQFVIKKVMLFLEHASYVSPFQRPRNITNRDAWNGPEAEGREGGRDGGVGEGGREGRTATRVDFVFFFVSIRDSVEPSEQRALCNL